MYAAILGGTTISTGTDERVRRAAYDKLMCVATDLRNDRFGLISIARAVAVAHTVRNTTDTLFDEVPVISDNGHDVKYVRLEIVKKYVPSLEHTLSLIAEFASEQSTIGKVTALRNIRKALAEYDASVADL